VVRKIENEEPLLEKFGLMAPFPAIAYCSSCHSGKIYDTEREGLNHLWYQHFQPQDTSTRSALLPPPSLKNWLRSESQLREELANIGHINLLQTFLDHITRTYRVVRKIQSGVVVGENAKSVKYKLPGTLVRYFENEVLCVLHVAGSVTLLNEFFVKWKYVEVNSYVSNQFPEVKRATKQLHRYIKDTEEMLVQAQRDFLAMSRFNSSMPAVGLATVGPEYIVAVITDQLRSNAIHENLDITSLYWHYTKKLQYQVNQHPRKRLLRDIQHVQEEADAVLRIIHEQKNCLERFEETLDPSLQRVTNRSRVTLFENLEYPLLAAGHETLSNQIEEFEAIKDRLLDLRDQVKQSIEILEEDHGKAIFVFTMVTIIFLPL
jgi:prefoldin subunit 5